MIVVTATATVIVVTAIATATVIAKISTAGVRTVSSVVISTTDVASVSVLLSVANAAHAVMATKAAFSVFSHAAMRCYVALTSTTPILIWMGFLTTPTTLPTKTRKRKAPS